MLFPLPVLPAVYTSAQEGVKQVTSQVWIVMAACQGRSAAKVWFPFTCPFSSSKPTFAGAEKKPSPFCISNYLLLGVCEVVEALSIWQRCTFSIIHLIGVQKPGSGHDVCSLAREGGNDTLADGQKLVAFFPQLQRSARAPFVSQFSHVSPMFLPPCLSSLKSFLSFT